MFRILFLAAAGLTFIRDYLVGHEQAASYIFSIMAVDFLADVALRPFYVRATRSVHYKRLYFSREIVAMAGLFALLVGGAAFAAAWWIDDKLFSLPIIASTPILIMYRYVSIYQLVSSRFYAFYGFDLAKAGLWFAYFGFPDTFFLISAFSVLLLMQIWLYLRTGPSGFQLARGRRLLALVFRHWGTDWPVQLQTMVATGSTIFDKPAIAGPVGSTLSLILMTKFNNFAVSMVSSTILTVWQVKIMNAKQKATIAGLFRANGWVIPIMAAGFLFLFLFAIHYLPVGQVVQSSNLLITLGVLWLVLVLVRDFIIRWYFTTGDFTVCSWILIGSFAWYLPLIALFPQLSTPVTTLLLYLVANILTISLLIAFREKTILKRMPARRRA